MRYYLLKGILPLYQTPAMKSGEHFCHTHSRQYTAAAASFSVYYWLLHYSNKEEVTILLTVDQSHFLCLACSINQMILYFSDSKESDQYVGIRSWTK